MKPVEVIEKLQNIFKKQEKTSDELKYELGYNPKVVARIQPQGGVKFEPNYVRLGDGNMTCLHVYKYQTAVNDFWLEPIVNMPNVLCTMDKSNASKREVVDTINKALSEQNNRFNNAKDNVERIDAQDQYVELNQLYDDIKIGEVLKYVHLRLYVKGKTLAELEVNTRKVMDELEGMNFRAAVFLNEQEWEWEGIFTSYKQQSTYLNKRKGKEIPATTIAGGYPFHYTYLHDPFGTFLGTTYTGGTVIFDMFHKDKLRKHYNGLIVGQMGSGKSTLLKKFVLDQAIKGNKIRILDITGEFGTLVDRLNGKQIALDGSEGIINPLQVFKTAIKDDGSTNEELSFMQHLSKMSVFYNYLKPTASDNEKSTFSSLLKKLYVQKKMWSDDRSIEIAITSFKAEEYPIFSDFLKLVQKELYSDIENRIINSKISASNVDILTSIEMTIENIVEIYGQIFDGHTSIQGIEDEAIVSFPVRNLMGMQGEIFQAQLFNIMNMLWDGMIVNGLPQFKEFNRGNLDFEDAIRYFIIMDEAHNIINTRDISQPAVLYIERFEREARKYFGGIFFASHLITDFIPEGSKSENAENVKKLFQLTQYKFIGQQDSSITPILKKVFDGQITDSEISDIPNLESGHFLLSISGVKNVMFKVEIPDEEFALFGGGA
jgi:hypothetical protein